MNTFVLILLIIIFAAVLIYVYGKTRSIECSRCGKISNMWNSRYYNNAQVCYDCFKQLTSNQKNNFNVNNTSNMNIGSDIKNPFNTNNMSNNTTYTSNIASDDNSVTINIKQDHHILGNDFTPLNESLNIFNNLNPFAANETAEPFKSTYEIANFIAVNEDDKTWSLYPFKQVFKYSDLADYSIKESTANMNTTFNISNDIRENFSDKLQGNNINFDLNKLFSNANIGGPLNQIELTVTLKNSNRFTVSYASNNKNDDSSSNNDVEAITSLLEKIKNNA